MSSSLCHPSSPPHPSVLWYLCSHQNDWQWFLSLRLSSLFFLVTVNLFTSNHTTVNCPLLLPCPTPSAWVSTMATRIYSFDFLTTHKLTSPLIRYLPCVCGLISFVKEMRNSAQKVPAEIFPSNLIFVSKNVTSLQCRTLCPTLKTQST